MTQPDSPRQTPPASTAVNHPASRREPSRDAQREEQRRKDAKPSEHRDVTDRDPDKERVTPNDQWLR